MSSKRSVAALGLGAAAGAVAFYILSRDDDNKGRDAEHRWKSVADGLSVSGDVSHRWRHHANESA